MREKCRGCQPLFLLSRSLIFDNLDGMPRLPFAAHRNSNDLVLGHLWRFPISPLVRVSVSARTAHTYVIGMSGKGKFKLLEYRIKTARRRASLGVRCTTSPRPLRTYRVSRLSCRSPALSTVSSVMGALYHRSQRGDKTLGLEQLSDQPLYRRPAVGHRGASIAGCRLHVLVAQQIGDGHQVGFLLPHQSVARL